MIELGGYDQAWQLLEDRFFESEYMPERRMRYDRRSGADRRRSLNKKRKQGKERRTIFVD